MRIDTKIIHTEVYSFSELSESAKEYALQKNIKTIDYEWWDFVYEDAKAIGALFGLSIDNIYFSGFSYQGDGACFDGSYEYNKGSLKKVREFAPEDTALHAIVEALQEIQRRHFYKLFATVKHSGHYQHENCTTFDIHHEDDYYFDNTDTEEELKDTLRDFMRWIYSRLQDEWENLISMEYFREVVEANDWEFTEDGEVYY